MMSITDPNIHPPIIFQMMTYVTTMCFKGIFSTQKVFAAFENFFMSDWLQKYARNLITMMAFWATWALVGTFFNFEWHQQSS